MHVVTVRLDRVFDVVHGMQNRRNVTLFGFQCGPRRVFGVCAPGDRTVAAGAVLSVCLREENDWTTLPVQRRDQASACSPALNG